MIGVAVPATAATTQQSQSQSQLAQALPSTISTLTWNVCGTRDGCPNKEKPQTKVDEIKRQVERDPSIGVVMVQETCEDAHSKPLLKALEDASGSEWILQHRTANFVGTTKPIKCDIPGTGGGGGGVAVAMKKFPGTTPMQWNYTFPGTRGLEHVDGEAEKPRTNYTTQGMACVGANSSNPANKIVACTSHFVHTGVHRQQAIRAASARDMAAEGRKWQRQGYRTVLGGDLNTKAGSPRLAPLRAFSFETDDDDRCSTSWSDIVPDPRDCGNVAGKIDHIFFGDKGLRHVDGDVLYSASEDGTSQAYASREVSDHWMLKGTVRTTRM
ncbi:hypothetical protein GCM10027091_20400 [Streptomyces daliensis]